VVKAKTIQKIFYNLHYKALEYDMG